MSVPRYNHSAVVLPDGRVAVLGGLGPSDGARRDVEIYDPKAGTFAKAGNLATGRWDLTPLLLPDGRILVTGGIGGAAPGTPVARVEIYDPATAQSTPLGSFSEPRFGLVLVPLADGRILAAGGIRVFKNIEDSILRSTDLIDLKAGTILPAAPMTERRAGANGFALPDGRVLILGGANGKQVLDSGEVYTP